MDADVYDTNIVQAAYLKAINVPCMYDIGILPSDPTDSRLCLNIIDIMTYNRVVKPDFLYGKRKQQRKKIDKFRQAV
jgi:hypothetical protein